MWHAGEEAMYQRLEEFLESRHATYDTVTHPAAVTAQEQAGVMHVPGRSVAKVVIVKERDGVVMAIVPAATDLDLDRFKGLIGHGDVRLASVEEIRAVVPDCPAGSIPPFGALYGLRAFIDRSLLGVPEVTMPAGDPGSAIRMRWSEFERLVDAHPGDFAIPQSVVAAGGVAQPRRRARRASSTPEKT
jgi:Ala-tRNA(Pro) deacylase